MSDESETPQMPLENRNSSEERINEPPPPPRAIRIGFPGRSRKPWVTWGLLAITILIYLLQMLSKNIYGSDLLLLVGAKVNDLIYSGEFWRLITPTFLHGSILHIAFNMYALYIIGPGLEIYYGHTRFLLLYLIAGFAGNVFSLLLTPAPSLGASTAIFGLIAAQGLFIYKNRFLFGKRSRALLGNILIIVIFNLVLGLNPGIDNWGHLGGLLGGAAFAWFAGPLLTLRQEVQGLMIEDKRNQNQAWTVFILVGTFFAAIIVLLKLFGI